MSSAPHSMPSLPCLDGSYCAASCHDDCDVARRRTGTFIDTAGLTGGGSAVSAVKNMRFAAAEEAMKGDLKEKAGAGMGMDGMATSQSALREHS